MQIWRRAWCAPYSPRIPARKSGYLHLLPVRRARGPRAVLGDRVPDGGRISLQNLHDSRVPDYAASLERLAGLEVDMLLPGHREISPARAGRRLRTARDVLRRGLLPGGTP
ncbi:hypothetical protein [Actinomadura mexicana]|nr:hypothetical protein [Actinomadura mexicana]